MAESRLRQDILKRIREDYPPRKSGVLIFGRPAGPSTGAGHPDLFGVALGRHFELEVKLPREKPTDLQIQRIQDLRTCGAYAWVVQSTLAATKAVYLAKKGERHPMADEPIDFDDWFKSVVTDAPAAPERPKTSEDMLAEPEPTIVDPQGETLDLGQPAPDILDITPQPKPEAEPVLSLATDPPATPEVQANARAAFTQAMTTAGGAYPAWEQVLEHIARLDNDIRTVGDRVTILYEAINRVETLLRSRHVLLGQIGEEVIRLSGVINKLLTEVQADELVGPTLVDEPTPFDDVAPVAEADETPKRGRGRPRKAS